jgi:hypothetical protein
MKPSIPIIREIVPRRVLFLGASLDGARPAPEGCRTIAELLIDAGLLAWVTEADP